MRKVLIVSSTKIVGGAEIVLSDYLRGNGKHEFYLYTTSKSEIVGNYTNVLSASHLYTSETMSVVSIRRRPLKPYIIYGEIYMIYDVS